jgi:hypothetical protein
VSGRHGQNKKGPGAHLREKTACDWRVPQEGYHGLVKKYFMSFPHVCHLCQLSIYIKQKNKTNSMVLVRKRTIPTEQPLLVGEVSANFSG